MASTGDAASAGAGAGAGPARSNSFRGFKGSPDLNPVFDAIAVAKFPAPAAAGVVVVPSDASVRDALEILVEHRILSAPVRDVTVTHPGASWAELYIGMVDMTDIVTCALEAVSTGSTSFELPTVAEVDEESDAAPAAGSASSSSAADHVAGLIRREEWFAKTKVTEAMHTFKFSPFVPLEAPTATMLDVMLILGKYGHHRVVIVQPSVDTAAKGDADTDDTAPMAEIGREDKRLVNIITQSAVVAQLAANAARLAPVTARTLEELELAGSTAPRRDVHAVHIDAPVHTAFKQMVDHRVSAVPIVGEDGSIIGVISNRDVRLVLGGSPGTVASASAVFSHLFSPCRAFLAALSRERDDLAHPSVVAKASDTLGLVMGRLAATRIHRVFVVDDRRRPVGVVSLRDVISVFVHEPKDYFTGGYFEDTVSASE